MLTFEGIQENFKFIVIETLNQVASTLDLLNEPSPATYDKIVSRDDYIDNLKYIIENKCFARLNAEKPGKKEEINRLRAIQIICINLERIADFCVNIARQVSYMQDSAFIKQYDYGAMFGEIRTALSLIEPVMSRRDLAGALAICKSEPELDRLYKEAFDSIMARLGEGREVQNLITTLFIFRYLERIGDSLLNIGEALIFFIIGERIKIHQFEALQKTLSKSGFEESPSNIGFQSIWGTRSGCRIGLVEGRRPLSSQSQESIFKEGNPKKIREEKEKLDRWAEVFPGLAPRVRSYHEDLDSASMLVEFIPGRTLDEIILGADEETLRVAFEALKKTIREIWRKTKKPGLVETDFVRQILSRLDEVRQVHPDFDRDEQLLGGRKICSMEELLETCREIDDHIFAPFSVFIHGDFNASNIVYNGERESIHYIDLHRSRDADYVQDASVFIVSNFRIPVFDDALRGRLDRVIEDYYAFVRGLAEEWGDSAFEVRMALALARSFFTSTRFELNPEFARDMHLRALFLLERVMRHSGRPWTEFRLPTSVFYY